MTIEQHLFEIENLNILQKKSVTFDQFNASLINKSINSFFNKCINDTDIKLWNVRISNDFIHFC